jgi:hypothetical protein
MKAVSKIDRIGPETAESIAKMTEMAKATVGSVIRDLHARREELSGDEIDNLDKAVKLLFFLKKQSEDDGDDQDMGALVERALKIPELRDAFKRTADAQPAGDDDAED